MIKLEQPIVVEGKYDKITLENYIDALIIPTDGFGIFKNKEKRDMLRRLAQKNGIIIMTDSDSAGHLIRAYIKKLIPSEKITNVYIPELRGKEKRKAHSGKAELLGVEGMSGDVILKALERSGVTGKYTEKRSRSITKADMYALGLSGRENSAEARRRLLKRLSLPESLSPGAMLDILNTVLTYEELAEAVASENEAQSKSIQN